MAPVVRFAPSPTGLLHVGNIRAALINWLLARKNGGTSILRLDDTDAERSREKYARAIREDLAWLGLSPDQEFKQSDRLAEYDTAAERLKADGRLYACYESPEELELKRKVQLSRGLPPVYDREALELSDADRKRIEGDGKRPHWRFKLDWDQKISWEDHIRGTQEFDLSSVSDPVLIRADGTYLYSLPSVVDDIDFKISHVVRGEDHVTNSAVQVQIFEALGAKAPEFAHFSLLTGSGGEGLSKRHGALSIQDLRKEEGIEPLALLCLLARLGTSLPVEPFTSLDPLVESFDLATFGRAQARFDVKELQSLNAKILHTTPFEAVADRLPGINTAFWDVVRPNLEKLSDVEDWRRVVEGPVSVDVQENEYLSTALELLPPGAVGPDTWKEWTGALKSETGRKGRDLFLPLRLALTGEDHGPEMAKLLPLLGDEKIRERLAAAS